MILHKKITCNTKCHNDKAYAINIYFGTLPSLSLVLVHVPSFCLCFIGFLATEIISTKVRTLITELKVQTYTTTPDVDALLLKSSSSSAISRFLLLSWQEERKKL